MIRLLDCTLRDGGYINNWEFGCETIKDTIARLEEACVDILELGFLKNEPYHSDRTVFNSVQQISALIPQKKRGVEYAAMVEVVNPIPAEMIAERADNTIDIIRVIVWKTKHDSEGKTIDALDEGFRYCKSIVDKGYRLCVQPARVDQYSDKEFISMLKLFQTLDPMAIYVVDSWGTLNAHQIMHYVSLADKTLKSDIAIGYHGHNNLMQAFGSASTFITSGIDRDLIVDASVYGIGRGAGNLNLELFAKYMNDTGVGHFKTDPIIAIYEKYVKDIYRKHEWGFSIAYYLTACYHCNPNYGEYYGMVKKLPETKIEAILKTITENDRVIFSREKAEHYLQLLYGDVV